MTNEQIGRIQAAVTLQKAGRIADAIAVYRQILVQTPDNFDCLYMLASLQAQQGHLDEAIDLFRRAGRIRPDVLDVQYNLAVALGLTGRHADAAKIYKRILDSEPRHPHARINYATSLMSEGKFADALRHYDELIAYYPDVADAYNNRGMALQALKRTDDALASYDKAIALRPSFPQAHVNRGNTLAALHRADEALSSFNKAIALQPDFADAHSNAGNIHAMRRSYGEAISAYDRALILRPEDSEARSMRLLAKMNLCDWSNFEAESASLLAAVDAGLPVYPFIVLPLKTTPERQLRCAQTFTALRYPPAARPLWNGQRYGHDRLRIAYVSADFREHAVANLTAGMFACHDRSSFEVSAISIGRDDGSLLRRRLEAAFDHFIDASTMTDEEIASRIRDTETDILIDLNGYTHGARMGVFAQRPTPTQVSYLGFSGTTGADYFDYVIADRTVIPETHVQAFSEKVVWLPDSFMVNDATRAIAERVPPRSALGLPENGFVFCCFNQPYKIGPAIFDVWMRLLKTVDGSVLWLKDNGAASSHNLRREAEQRGVGPERLVFAPSLPLAADHLARQRQADLFLDTLPYNAHATTSDALWAGLPVVTCLGETLLDKSRRAFSKRRVSAS